MLSRKVVWKIELTYACQITKDGASMNAGNFLSFLLFFMT